MCAELAGFKRQRPRVRVQRHIHLSIAQSAACVRFDTRSFCKI